MLRYPVGTKWILQYIYCSIYIGVYNTMGLFGKTKEKPTRTEQEIGLLWAKVEQIKAQLDGIEQKYKSLQGLINRKLGNEPETETNIKNDPFNFLRNNGNF